MSCHNPYKRSLVAPMFVEGIGKRGQPFFRRQVLVNVEKVDNQRLMDVSVAGLPLTAFHGEILKLALPSDKIELVNGCDWFGRYPNGAIDYYVDLWKI
jgi:hypothetical protein